MNKRFFGPLSIFLMVLGMVFAHSVIYNHDLQWVIHGGCLFLLGLFMCLVTYYWYLVFKWVTKGMLIFGTLNILSSLFFGSFPGFHLIASLPFGVGAIYCLIRATKMDTFMPIEN